MDKFVKLPLHNYDKNYFTGECWINRDQILWIERFHSGPGVVVNLVNGKKLEIIDLEYYEIMDLLNGCTNDSIHIIEFNGTSNMPVFYDRPEPKPESIIVHKNCIMGVERYNRDDSKYKTLIKVISSGHPEYSERIYYAIEDYNDIRDMIANS